VIMIVSRLPGENVRLDGDFDKAMNREWDVGDFRPLGSAREVDVQFQGQQHFAQLQVFQDDTQALRNQFLLGLPWGGQTVYLQANGPADLLTQASLQEALDGVVGKAQELMPPELESTADATPPESTDTEQS
jgi:hypothetical protein